MTVSTTLVGIGIGRGIAVGPILRMPDPLPEPCDARFELRALPDRHEVDAAHGDRGEDGQGSVGDRGGCRCGSVGREGQVHGHSIQI